MSRFPFTRLLIPRRGPSMVPVVQTFSSSSYRFFSSSSSSTNPSKVPTPGTGISEHLKPLESVALPSQSHATAMNQSVDISPSVDQGLPVATNITSSSESLGWIGDLSQRLASLETAQVVQAFAASVAIGSALYAMWTYGVSLQRLALDRQKYGAPLREMWTDDDLDAIIDHYRAQPLPIKLSKFIQDQGTTPLLFPLNPDVSDLLEYHDVLLIEGGSGEGKTTQVFRTLFDKCSQTSTEQRPLILTGSFRNARLTSELLSYFFVNYQFPFKVTDYEKLLRFVLKRAMDKSIPVYIVSDDAQQVVDMHPDGEVGPKAQSFFATLMLLSWDYPVKIVHIANRMFSHDLDRCPGHNSRFHAYQWSYDPALLRSTLEQSNNPMIVRHLDELLGMFGTTIQNYIQLMELMDEIGNGDVDNEEVYQAAVKQMKDKCRDDIENALYAVGRVDKVAGAAEGHKLLTKLLEEQGKSVSSVRIAHPKIVRNLVRSNIIHGYADVTWASRFTSVVFKERYDEFAPFIGKSTSQKE